MKEFAHSAEKNHVTVSFKYNVQVTFQIIISFKLRCVMADNNECTAAVGFLQKVKWKSKDLKVQVCMFMFVPTYQ